MANRVKISAAGSGKTYDICIEALEAVKNNQKKSLIVTYTNRGHSAVEKELRKQNCGVLHPQVIVKTWYRFLLADAIKPYQRSLFNGNAYNVIKGIDYSRVYGAVNYHKKGTVPRYISVDGNVLSNQASELACYLNDKSGGKVVSRLFEIYSDIYFDEIQDLAGYDIEFLKLLLDSDINITCCGDNKQATFSTHNAKKNKCQTGKNIWQFFSGLSNVEIEKKLASRRFNKDICCFANKIFPVGEQITTVMQDITEHDGVYLISESDASSYFDYYKPQVLRYNAKTKIESFHPINFGESKGETFDRVMIFPNGPMTDFILKGKAIISPEKYYVGVTRPRYSIAIVLKQLPKTLVGYEEDRICMGEHSIKSLRFISTLQ